MPSSGVQTCALDRKSTRLNSSHGSISYAVFCLKKNITLFYLRQHTPPSIGSPSAHHERAPVRAPRGAGATRPARRTPRCRCGSSFFFFNDTATTEIYTLSLHDALPIYIDLSTDDTVCALSVRATELTS